MTQQDASETIPVEAAGRNGSRARNSRATGARKKAETVPPETVATNDPAASQSTSNRRKGETASTEAAETNSAPAGRSTAGRRKSTAAAKDEVAAQLFAKLEAVNQELGRERLLREQAESDARHKLDMAHERIRDLEEKLAEQREFETALLAARQRVADLEVQLALKHEGRRERRHHSRRDKRSRRWWAFGR